MGSAYSSFGLWHDRSHALFPRTHIPLSSTLHSLDWLSDTPLSAAHLRQTIILSRHETPETRALYNKSLKNVAGKVRAVKRYGAVRVPEGVDTVR